MSAAEQAVVGAVFCGGMKIYDLCQLKPEHFAIALHRSAWQAFEGLVNENSEIDLITVDQWMRDHGIDCDLSAYGMIAKNTPSTANAEHYAKLVRDDAMGRKLSGAVNEMLDVCSQTMPNEDKIEKCQGLIFDVTNTDGSQEVGISSAISNFLNTLDDRHSGKPEALGLTTGLRDLDGVIGGLMPGQLCIIAGRTSMGKTTLALNIAEHALLKGKSVIIFSLEMMREELVEKLVSSMTRINSDKLRTGRLSDSEFDLISNATAKLNHSPIGIVDKNATTYNEQAVACRNWKRRHGLDLVVVDHLQLMTGRGETRSGQIEGITRSFKAMAKELNVPVMLLSQVNRECEKRNNKRPVLSDLRESGGIEQDADKVVFIYRDEVYDVNSPDVGVAELLISKNRGGTLGNVRAAANLNVQRFDDLAKSNVVPMGQKYTGIEHGGHR